MNQNFKFHCPICPRKYLTREQAMTCADADVKEKFPRRLKKIESESKGEGR